MEIVPGVHRVEGVRGANIYLLVDEELTLIDTGFPGNASAIERYVRSLGRQPDEIRHILVTHSHPDHAGSVGALRRRTGASVLAHRDDTRQVKDQAYLSYLGIGSLPLPGSPRVLVDGFVEDGQVLPTLGGLEVLHAPGHTPGSICLYLRERGVLFTGDLVVNRGQRISPPLPFPRSNRERYRTSLERVAGLDFEVACFAHGGVWRVGTSREFRRLVRWYVERPLWRRVLGNIPTLLRFGVQMGMKRD